MSAFLLLPNLKIHNANALSSPFTIGFPAITSWMGAAHALERRLNSVKFTGVGIFSHHFVLHTYKESFFHSIVGTRNSLKEDGNPSAFIAEARCDLEVSLLLQMESFNELKDDKSELEERVKSILHTMKFASGDLLGFKSPVVEFADENNFQSKLMRELMPGYALIERRDLMEKSMREEGKNALESLLDGVVVRHFKDNENHWKKERKYRGWIIPVATGFYGISDISNPGETLSQRDPSFPHCFAESVVTLGEFKMAYRFEKATEIIWKHRYYEDKKLYVCQMNN